jgi:alpha-1,3/alpha-1,6-mannosyltransferase
MRGADRVVVNSNFTKTVVLGVWSGLGGQNGLGVVYPCVDTQQGTKEGIRGFPRLWGGKKVVLSINRFERKKDVGLAIKAFAKLSKRTREVAKLIIAGSSLPCIWHGSNNWLGGYDDRERENVGYHEELEALAKSLGLTTATAKNGMTAGGDADVLFLLSVPAKVKDMLLKTATLLLYTPANEHFGIVPLEAMLAGVPVLATNSGGPLETVLEGKTGWLRDPADVDAWAAVVGQALGGLPDAEVEAMGAAGRERVVTTFSAETMAATLDDEIRHMQRRARVQTLEIRDLFLALGMLGAVAIGVLGILWWKSGWKIGW